MTHKYVVSLLLVCSMLMQAPPDLRGNEKRKELQEKLLARAKAQGDTATVARVNRAREENAQASQEYVQQLQRASDKKNTVGLGTVSGAVRAVVTNAEKAERFCALHGATPTGSRRTVEQLAKLTTDGCSQ